MQSQFYRTNVRTPYSSDSQILSAGFQAIPYQSFLCKNGVPRLDHEPKNKEKNERQLVVSLQETARKSQLVVRLNYPEK